MMFCHWVLSLRLTSGRSGQAYLLCDHRVCPCPCQMEVLLLHRAVGPVFMRQCLAEFSTQKYYVFRLIVHSSLSVA